MRARAVAATAVLTLGLAVAGCGGSDGGSSGGGSGNEVTVKVGYVPYVGAAPFVLGVEKGFFKKRGINVKMSEGPAPAPIMAQVVSGQLDVGFTTIPALISAAVGGAPLQVIAPVDGLIDPKNPQSAILVRKDSDIQRPADLVGKKVGVVALQSALDVLLHEVVRKDGGDQKAVKSVQVPFPEMAAALKAGRVDAVVSTEPFVTLAVKAGTAKALAYPEAEVVPRKTVTAWAASKRYAEQNKETVQDFDAAMKESLAYAKAHPSEARATMVKIADIKPSLLKEINLGVIFEPKLTPESVTQFGDLMKDFGYVKDPPSSSELVPSGGS